MAVANDRNLLRLAGQHLADADLRIARQRNLIARLRVAGYPTELADQLLRSMVETREQMRIHRDYIRARQRGG